MEQTGTRRDRLRAATVREITQTARRILVEQGAEAVTLRAIAREMGMTAPALYRYFDSHQELLRHLAGDLFTELTDNIEGAIREVPADSLKGKFLAASIEFRNWALEHRREYTMLFGTPLPGGEAGEEDDWTAECGRRFGRTFVALFLELWHVKPFPVPADDEIDPGLRAQIERYRSHLGVPDLPIGVIVVFLSCWIRLQGFVTLEVFGHLSFALDESGPMFDLMMHDLAERLGLTHDLG
ncbi:TetR/AcrR family transcriptional regulator [Actinomadura scrupuli]|uniref:TetR/AcrR family transcriptional regulator n=1 Tax=Actinomadura scrupuli TaxID=559629 RepID=UPI003D95CC01